MCTTTLPPPSFTTYHALRAMNYIITTTINIPTLLKDYALDAKQHRHDFQIIVIGDKKSPSGTKEFCEQIPNTLYFGPAEQKKQFGHLPLFDHLPYNSVQRRNLAYIYCFQQGFGPNDTLITIDDDNFLKNPNYINQHLANRQISAETISATSPTWYNPLTSFYPENIFPRGYSFFFRHLDQQPVDTNKTTNNIAISAGLWEKNPDVDAVTNLIGLPGSCEVFRTEPLVLGKNILCPFNTQNTAYFSNFLQTAFLSPYMGRYDDILSSYITKRIADHLGFGLCFGQPIVIQDRNDHNLYKDLSNEVHGMSLTDSFVSFLYSVSLTSTSIIECFQQLADALHNEYPKQSFASLLHNTSQPWSLTKMAEGMKIWIGTLDKLNVKSESLQLNKEKSYVKT